MDWSKVKYFTQKEWEPHSDKVDPTLIFLMDDIRKQYGKPIVIHCAYAQGGHSSKSQHYLGKAVDFHFVDNDYAKQFELLCSNKMAGGVGYYNPNIWNHSGFHLDIRPVRLYWTQRNGVYVYGIDAVMEDLHGK